MTAFEHYFIEDKATHKEAMNPYYQLSEKEDCCRKILKEFGLSPEEGHIINGHVPVKLKDGETPVKAGGKLFVIDGGLSKAYQSKTGIAGYTLIFNSHHLALAEHMPFCPGKKNTPKVTIVEKMKKAYNGRRHRSWKGTGSADRRFKGVGERLPGWYLKRKTGIAMERVTSDYGIFRIISENPRLFNCRDESV